MHQSSVSRHLYNVINCLAALHSTFIKFPAHFETEDIKREFHGISGFPGVIGLIDGTQIPIKSPGGDHAELYRNRKGFKSINVQVVSNHRSMITNIVARWPGSTHDARIFNCSNICEKLQRENYHGHLLGDQGYPCLEFLLTLIGAA